jgi:phospholipid/cholesterol/gamma-HCH transport system substrate-binding protein
MNKSFFTREVKVGIVAVIAIAVLYFGLNFLKGIDIFSSVNYYYGKYENVGGLLPSSPVYVKGLKVGQVEAIDFDFSKQEAFVVKISVSKDIHIPKGARIELYDDGLMGGKAIQLIYAPIIASQEMYASGDTLDSQVGMGLMTQLTGELLPKIESVTLQTDSLIRAVRSLVESKELKNSLNAIERTSADLASSSAQIKLMMNNDLPHILKDVNGITSDFRQISGKLKMIDYAKTFASVDYTLKNLNLITDKINSTEGTIGLLLNDKELYMNLTSTVASSDKLLIDLQKNPKRYVHFSLFGKKVE